jgi:hypothetical protein
MRRKFPDKQGNPIPVIRFYKISPVAQAFQPYAKYGLFLG